MLTAFCASQYHCTTQATCFLTHNTGSALGITPHDKVLELRADADDQGVAEPSALCSKDCSSDRGVITTPLFVCTTQVTLVASPQVEQPLSAPHIVDTVTGMGAGQLTVLRTSAGPRLRAQ
jgi:hypothetical protein